MIAAINYIYSQTADFAKLHQEIISAYDKMVQNSIIKNNIIFIDRDYDSDYLLSMTELTKYIEKRKLEVKKYFYKAQMFPLDVLASSGIRNKLNGLENRIAKHRDPKNIEPLKRVIEATRNISPYDDYVILDKSLFSEWIKSHGESIDYAKYLDLWLVTAYNYLSGFNENGLAKVSHYNDNKYGFVDEKGKVVVPVVYDNIWDFKNGLAKVSLNGKYGLIDEKGKVILLAICDDIIDFENGLAKIELYGKWGEVDKKGNVIVKVIYDYIWDFKDGLAKVKLNGKHGFIDNKGVVVVPIIYDDIINFENELARVKLNNRWGVVDESGKEIISVKYDVIHSFNENLAVVSLNWKFGFIDKTGREVIPIKYDWAYDFSDGLARVKLNDKKGNSKFGFINEANEIVIPIKYDYAENFSNGVALVKLKSKSFFIDKRDKKINKH